MNKTDIRSTLDQESIRLTKALGQNLLHDQNVLQRIIKAGDLTPEDKVLEVGPGLGALTEHLLPAVGQLTAIEMDRRLEERLRARFGDRDNFNLRHHDALDFFAEPDINWSDWKLISNMPYSMASPLLVDLASMTNGPRRLVVTLQLEVAQRLYGKPGTKEYSKLTLLVGCRYIVGRMFKISPHCFFPEPKVNSACLTLDRRTEPLFEDSLYKPFATVVKRAFSQRRKMMRKNLRGGWPDEVIDMAMAATDLDAKIRAEKVTLEQFIELTRNLHDA
ncbi:MAG: 16S rRNA (adenine(1518)-N(6)/adenine(1519)-N(6))-dimethyltransferase RsmA [Verrucomicrobiota bacterium]|jgi:16S rRNA (adenine1518-N6/adenine1519-N6)-dimethyltransferase|nr:16S rRNA (adenine(1518)-N(6)/adenine(1519)-N(6))-dimethyltransferase RsmA [Verrucomicrobiota bacterium]